ncbi:hypothetical protein L6Q79_12765 [bacterium]|nr:hypothetical protein [bacterium]NUN45377.1 hypothetical protein [bacterium]
MAHVAHAKRQRRCGGRQPEASPTRHATGVTGHAQVIGRRIGVFLVEILVLSY